MSLSQTVALVTGGSSGLGAAAVRALRRQGAAVMIADVQEPTGHALLQQQEMPNNNRALHWSRVDVTDPDSVTQALDACVTQFGQPVNAVVQCAGIATARKMISGKGAVHSLEDFQKTIQVNTIGTFNVARLAAERIKENAANEDGLRGCLVHTASIAAYEGQMGQVAYAASKGAIVGMTLPMARDLASFGIRVMTIVRFQWVVRTNANGLDSRRSSFFCLSSCFMINHQYRLLGCSKLPCWKDCPSRYKRSWARRFPALAD